MEYFLFISHTRAHTHTHIQKEIEKKQIIDCGTEFEEFPSLSLQLQMYQSFTDVFLTIHKIILYYIVLYY